LHAAVDGNGGSSHGSSAYLWICESSQAIISENHPNF
jgi:hypothetical protein